jgi:hypothetical protein
MVDGEFTGNIDPTAIGKPDIDKGNIGMNVSGQSDGGISATGLSDHHYVVRRLEDLPGADALHFVVVDQKDPQLAVRAAANWPSRSVGHASHFTSEWRRLCNGSGAFTWVVFRSSTIGRVPNASAVADDRDIDR